MLVKSNIQIISGAKAVIETLKKLSVDRIFGYPGGVVLDLYDELYKQTDIKHILVRHEQFAVHAAEGYARESGKCGVVLVTSGPGATNTITGINNAYLDGYPLIVLTGQVSKASSGNNAYQEANICEMTKTCTKANFQITDASDIEQTLIKAYRIAMEGKKGPVVVDLVKDIFSQETEYSDILSVKPFQIVNSFTSDDIVEMNNIISKSQKPVIVIGGGVHHSKAYDELENFVDFYKIPVVFSMMGAGAYKKDFYNFGMIGINGDAAANELIKTSDLIIAFGCRFNDRVTSGFGKCDLSSKTIIVDLESDRNCRLFVKGDINSVLKSLNCINIDNCRDKFLSWATQAQDYRNLNKSHEKLSNLQHGFEVLQKLNEYTKDRNIVFTSDVGQHQVLAVKNITTNQNRRIYVSGGAGTMGFGLPAAIGCAVANPEAEIVCITGDGSFQMSLSELALCKDLGLNIKVVILNNGYLGMVRQLQQKNHAGRYSQTKITSPDFVTLAQSYGLEGLKVQCPAEIEMALNKAFSQKGTFILDFKVESMEIV